MQASRSHHIDKAERLALHDAPVVQSRYVDRARAEALGKLGVHTIGDLVRHYPARYLDLSQVANLRDVRPGSDATVIGRVHEVKVKKPKPRLTITEVALVDGTGVLIGVWFNQPYIQSRFKIGDRVAFAGRVDLEFGFKQIRNPFTEKLSTEDEDGSGVGRVLPVHRATEGLTTGWLRRLVAAALEDAADVPDHLPAHIRAARDLVPLAAALRDVHFPASIHDAMEARRRLAYDELLLLQLYMAMRRHALTREQAGFAHKLDGPLLAALRAKMPFVPSADQRKAIDEMLADMAQPRPMNRLLLGDVGTGKTLVAAHALAAAADSGSQAAMMAPTEVLAIQYAEKVGPLLESAGVSWALLTGSIGSAERREILSGTADGSIQILFGTHALLEESVAFKRLSLAIVDEQHRFGVNQRLGLRSKGASADLLVMTATPIPRSLALTLYGDLATSYLRERPVAGAAVTTEALAATQKERAYSRIRSEISAGHQAYVICALVDESDAAQAKAATREAERLRTEVFPDLRVGLLTGRMRPAEKARTMREFRSKQIDVLVSTTVVEVGVDVPNATVMVIEDADRFGLAQLHQLRGRVGRGEHPGTVYLFAESRSKEAISRLSALVSTSDGFTLAEQDLKLRGEGRVLGDKQHGMPELRLASVLTDIELIEMARTDAFALIASDPHLALPENAPLLREVKRAFESAWEWVSSG